MGVDDLFLALVKKIPRKILHFQVNFLVRAVALRKSPELVPAGGSPLVLGEVRLVDPAAASWDGPVQVEAVLDQDLYLLVVVEVQHVFADVLVGIFQLPVFGNFEYVEIDIHHVL